MTRLISLVGFLGVAIIVWWSATGNFGDNALLQTPQSEHYIEIFMNDFEIVTMDDNGTPAYKLNGKQLKRYNDSDQAEIELPVFYLLDTKSPWIVSADSALVNNKNNTITLKDNVLMQQKNSEPAITIRTQSLRIHTKTQIAQTQAQVAITRGKSQLTSSGMIYNHITSKLELNANVSGFYLPYE